MPIHPHVEISLTWQELVTASFIGLRRQIFALQHELEDPYGSDPEDCWGNNIEGACGECAVAKWLGLYWDGTVGSLGGHDVGPFQVRTARKHSHSLILHKGNRRDRSLIMPVPRDADDKKFILVTGLAPHFWIRGWCLGRDGKHERFWEDRARKNRPAYFVPQDFLQPLDTLWDNAFEPVPAS
jgi:hypothetical protein